MGKKTTLIGEIAVRLADISMVYTIPEAGDQTFKVVAITRAGGRGVEQKGFTTRKEADAFRDKIISEMEGD